MTALLSSGFSGSTLRLQKLLLVILHQHTIDIDSVHSLYTIALLRVSKQHTRAACPMSKMACCSTTSKILIVFLLICSSKSCPHICLLTSFINRGFTIFFFLSGMHIIKLGLLPLPWYGKMRIVANMLLIRTTREKYQVNNMYVCVLLFELYYCQHI